MEDERDNLENPIFDGSFSAEGMYENMRFVVRLSPINHNLVNSIGLGIATSRDIPYENLKAYGTFIHENIHWWQHVGSTSGLFYSLSYMAQFYVNRKYLLDIVKSGITLKPLISAHINELDGANEIQDSINIVVNNYIDIEFYKMYAFNPEEQVRKIIDSPYFDSIGHSYSTVYGNVINIIASIADREFDFLPDIRQWEARFSDLRMNRTEGYYFGSPIRVPPIGLLAIYEGQARLIQLQYLSRATGELEYDH